MNVARVFRWVLLFLFVLDFLLVGAMHGFNEQAIRTDGRNADTMRLYYSRVELIFNVINCPGVVVIRLLDRPGITTEHVAILFGLLVAEAWLYSVLYVSWRQRRTRKAN